MEIEKIENCFQMLWSTLGHYAHEADVKEPPRAHIDQESKPGARDKGASGESACRQFPFSGDVPSLVVLEN